MLNKYWLICLLIGLNSSALAQPDSLFRQGTEAYANGNFQEAKVLFEETLPTGFESASLFLNLGNTYFRLREPGLARWAYEKAALLEPWSPDVNQNLEIIQSIQADKITVLPQITLMDGFIKFLAVYRSWISVSVLVVVSLLAGYLLVRAMQVPLKRAMKTITYLLVGLSILFQVGLFLHLVYGNRSETGFLIPSITDVKSEPRDGSATLFQLHAATRVDYISEFEGWVQIRLENGNSGWLPATSVRFLGDILKTPVAITESAE